MKLSHDDLARSLADHFLVTQDGPMVWTDMQLGPSGSPRPDVYVIPKTYTALRPMVYEVKVSLSDFRADVTAGKWQSYRPMCSGIYFAFPGDLAIPTADVPSECGIIRRNTETGQWRAVRKPVLRPIDNLPAKVWQKLLIDGVDRAHKSYRKHSEGEYLMVDRLRKLLGNDVADFVGDAKRARARMDAIKAGTDWEILEAKKKAAKSVEEAREAARRELDRERWQFDSQMSRMRESMGLASDAGVEEVATRMRQVVSLLSGEMLSVERARTQLAAANDALASVVELVGSISKSEGKQHA